MAGGDELIQAAYGDRLADHEHSLLRLAMQLDQFQQQRPGHVSTQSLLQQHTQDPPVREKGVFAVLRMGVRQAAMSVSALSMEQLGVGTTVRHLTPENRGSAFEGLEQQITEPPDPLLENIDHPRFSEAPEEEDMEVSMSL